MRIVFLAPFGIRPKGTVQARMLPLAKALQARGHELEIVAPPYTNPADAGLVEQVEGVTVRNVALGPAIGLLAAPLIAWRMLRTALDQQPDLIHLFKPKGYGGLAALLLLVLRQCGLKLPLLVVDSDDREGTGGMNDQHPYSWPEKRLFAFQEQVLTRWADGVTVASRALESLAWGMGARQQRTLYLPNGPLLRPTGDRLAGRQRFGIAPDLPVLLLYTRFFEFSQQRLHQVLERLCQWLPQLRVLVVGLGPRGEERELEQAAFVAGFGDAVVMAGWQEPAALPDCLAAADAAIYLFDDSLLNRTKCPAKLAELAAAGMPLAAERVGQVGEYLVHNESALLVTSGDVDGLVEAAQRLLADRELASRLGAAAAQRVRIQFAWENAAVRLEQLYDEVRRS
ncbi:glycosyltransferase family 4 protein [Trichlorobacter sp.]|uniref:glycosyltransferase family 4 protein n=1 Tax=Trichlorobacter sp. TaxID=2911007 RepID=UPI002A36FFE5|nr:glycosyltransferase family 4 protein [Trichlorobacter sp.]MDY0384094.1 glycosyltransferase family 4 protein [Trichlorobacter sp.]